MKMKQLGLFIGATYSFEYTNHRDVTATRIATLLDAQFGAVEGYYPTPRLLFLMSAHDRDGAPRSFDPTKINFDTWRAI